MLSGNLLLNASDLIRLGVASNWHWQGQQAFGAGEGPLLPPE